MCLHLKLVQFSSNPSVIFNRQVAGWITKILKNSPSVKINFLAKCPNFPYRTLRHVKHGETVKHETSPTCLSRLLVGGSNL